MHSLDPPAPPLKSVQDRCTELAEGRADWLLNTIRPLLIQEFMVGFDAGRHDLAQEIERKQEEE